MYDGDVNGELDAATENAINKYNSGWRKLTRSGISFNIYDNNSVKAAYDQLRKRGIKSIVIDGKRIFLNQNGALDKMNSIKRLLSAAWDYAKSKATVRLGLDTKRELPGNKQVKQVFSDKIDNDDTQPRYYDVKAGDNLTKIAKSNNVSVQQLISLNGIANANKLRIGQRLLLSGGKKSRGYRNRNEYDNSLTNLDAIQSVNHDGNYAVIDKKNRTLSVYDSDNKLVYNTKQLSTGVSKNDYNTITYVDSRGVIRNNAGNNSTPAGITVITGIGSYHGSPNFTRSRNPDDMKDEIASSMHIGNINSGSNGCVRLSDKALKDLTRYLGVGSYVYTLPEKEGSKFIVREGKLSFVADNPYGNDDKKSKKRFWDDYNVYTNKSYSPLRIDIKDYDGSKRSRNMEDYAMALSRNKKDLQKRFGISSYTYNQLAYLAMGLAEQESKFNTSTRKKAKDAIGDDMLDTIKRMKRGSSGARSRGYTQIKLSGDNDDLKNIYKEFGINADTIESADKSALATMARLIHIYQNEVQGKEFTGADGEKIDTMDAIMYKWMGKNNELKNHTATPERNTYIRNVKKYANNFDYYTTD